MKYPFLKLRYYQSLLRDLLQFIRKPSQLMLLSKSTKFKIYDTIGLFILKMVFLIPLILFFALVYDPKNQTGASMADRFSPLILLLVGGLILPVLEEVCFRLSLRFKPVYLALSSGVLLYYILTKAVYHTKISAIDDTFMMRMLPAMMFSFILLSIFNLKKVKARLAMFWRIHFRTIYYLSCVLFAAVHVFKYELTWLNIALLPLLTLPQLMSALIYGYTRISFGFQYPLLFHMSTNVLAIGISLLPFTD